MQYSLMDSTHILKEIEYATIAVEEMPYTLERNLAAD